MSQDAAIIPRHLREFGLVMLGRALKGCCIKPDCYTPPYEGQEDFSIPIIAVQAAHGAELVLKARIAEQHPLLVFSKLPSPSSNDEDEVITLNALHDKGRSYYYSELPDILWATTGQRVPRLELFRDFGYLRNQITHLGVPPETDLRKETLAYILTVIEPMVKDFWRDSVVSYAERWVPDIVSGGYLEHALRCVDIAIDTSLRELLGEESEAGYRELLERARIQELEDREGSGSGL